MKTLNKVVKGKSNSFLSLVGLIIGILSIIIGLKLVLDFNSINHKDEGDSNAGYLLVNKELNLLSSFSESSSRFSNEEINDLNKKEWILSSSGFIPNNYRATLSSKQFNFRTELFFESIDKEFIDGQFDSFEWEVDDETVPVILSNQFYNLYNFGFASGQGLPKVSKGMLKEFSFDLKVSGKGKYRKMKMKIIGFSDRISSVLVPQSFNNWANSYFGNGNPEVSRMVIKVKDLTDPSLEENLNGLNLEVNKELLGGKAIGRIVNIASMVIASFGFFVLLLSILNFSYLIKYKVSEFKEQRKVLFLIGYNEKAISKAFLRPILKQMLLVLAMVAFIFYLINHQAQKFYYELGIYVESNPLKPIFVGVIISTALFFWIKLVLKKEFKS